MPLPALFAIFAPTIMTKRMKSIRTLLPILLVAALVVAACTGSRPRYKRVLDEAERLMTACPDSSLILLNRYKDEKGQWPLKERMRFDLLRTNALNKTDILFTSDSIALLLANYFDRHGSANERMLAHYLLGRAYYDMGEFPMSLKCYHDAIDCADTTDNCDYSQLSKVYSQMGLIYYQQNLLQQQILVVNKSIEYALKANDTLSAMSNYWQKCNAYEQSDNKHVAIAMLDTLARWYKTHGDYQNYAMASGRAFAMLVEIQDNDKAQEYMSVYERLSGLFDDKGNIGKGREIYYYYKGKHFLNINNTDSAIYYFRKELLEGKDFNNQNAGAKGLAETYQKMHRLDSAAKYALYSYAMNDSAYSKMATQDVEQINALYNYSRNQEIARKKTEELELEKRNRKIAVGLSLLIALSSGLLIYRFVYIRKEAMDKYKSTMSELSQLKAEKMAMSKHETEYKSFIEEKERHIANLEKRMSKYGSQLYFKTATAERCLQESESYVHIAKIAIKGQPISESDWQKILLLITEYLPGFDDFLTTNKIRLKQNEYNICALLRLHFKAVDIAGMLELSKSQVSQHCTEIMRKVFEEKGSSKELSGKLSKIF